MSELSAIGALSGTLSGLDTLSGLLSVENSLSGTLSTEHVQISYEGPYIVTPSVDTDILLETKSKLMADNVTVEKVPYRVNDNLSNGLTVYIGD